MPANAVLLTTQILSDTDNGLSPLTLIGHYNPTKTGNFGQRVLAPGQSVTAYTDAFSADNAVHTQGAESCISTRLCDALKASGADLKAMGTTMLKSSAQSLVDAVRVSFAKRGATLDTHFNDNAVPIILQTATDTATLKVGMKAWLDLYTACETDVQSYLNRTVMDLAKTYPSIRIPADIDSVPSRAEAEGHYDLLDKISQLPLVEQFAGYEMLLAYVKESSKLAYRPYSESRQ